MSLMEGEERREPRASRESEGGGGYEQWDLGLCAEVDFLPHIEQ